MVIVMNDVLYFDYMRRKNNLGPKARKPLCPEDLRLQTLIKKIADDFRKTNLHVLLKCNFASMIL